MNLYQEIAILKKYPHQSSGMAAMLLATGHAWNDRQSHFLRDMAEQDYPISTLQGEFLISLRNQTRRRSTYGGFSVRELVRKCHMLRGEFEDGDEDLADYVATLAETDCQSLTDPQWKRLIVAAKRCGEIEPYMFVG
ncbi:MAG: hypothetical protein ABL893_11280 [Hyphomicrobium sp.]